MLAGGGILLAATGCGNTASTGSSSDTEFVAQVRARVPSTSASDDQIVNTGRTVCQTLSEGHDVISITNQVAGGLVSPTDAAFIVGRAIRDYCPQYFSKITDAMN